MSFVFGRMSSGGIAPRWFQDKSRQVGPLVVGLTAVLGLAVADLQGAEAYLAPHDKIMWIGDSITAQNLYNPMVMQVLATLYPEAGISDVNCGTGGATAPSQFGSIPPRVDKEQPTILTVMFGVNDTRWSVTDEPDKVENYTRGLQQYADLARQRHLDLVFLRETHFSHNRQAEELETGLNRVLGRLFAAMDQVAAANGRPVIDTFGAYTRQLEKAWQADPKYEFTPNFVHPTMHGHAAVAGEILRAWGAGLPLSKAVQRGPLHLGAKQAVELSAVPAAGLLGKDKPLAIKIRAAAAGGRARAGKLIAVIGQQKFSLPLEINPQAPTETTIQWSPAGSQRRWDVLPIYLAFVAEDEFAAAAVPLYWSRLIPTAASPFQHDAQGWVEWEGYKPAASAVDDVQAVVGPQSVRVEFAWRDSTPVLAQGAPFKSRLGQPVGGPLDLTSPFGQPCDAVEVLLDLRGEQSSGRCTSNMDSIPEVTLRVGLYKIEESGRVACKLQVSPESAAGAVKLAELGGDRYAIEWTGPVPKCGVGFNLLASDAKEYKPNQFTGAWLTSVPLVGVDWTDFFRLSASADDMLYRVGY